MKKIIVLMLSLIIYTTPVFAKVDKFSAEYLRDKKHFAIMNPMAESIAQKIIKKTFKKETGANCKVKFDGYTLSSMKKGIFKNLEISAKDFVIEDIDVKYLKFKTISDYNWIDYKENPPVVKSDMTYAYEIHLTENSINQALDKKEYKKTLEKVNNIAYPLFILNDVQVRMRNDKLYIIMDYNFPLSPMKNNKTFMVSTGFKVVNNKIIANNVGVDSAYGNIKPSKVSNLINLLDPLSFTLSLMNEKKCNSRIDNVKIIDNIIQINGRIFVEGD